MAVPHRAKHPPRSSSPPGGSSPERRRTRIAPRTCLAGGGLIAAALFIGHMTVAADIREGSGAIPTRRLSIRALHPDALGGVEASPRWQLSRDTVAAPTVTAGSADYADLCAVGAGGKSFQPGTRVGWQVEGRLLDVGASGARVWIRWTRRVLDPRVVDAGDVVREHEARLTEGDNVVLDLVRPPAGTNPECDGVVVQMGLEFTEAPSLANAVLDYDVWLPPRGRWPGGPGPDVRSWPSGSLGRLPVRAAYDLDGPGFDAQRTAIRVTVRRLS